MKSWLKSEHLILVVGMTSGGDQSEHGTINKLFCKQTHGSIRKQQHSLAKGRNPGVLQSF